MINIIKQKRVMEMETIQKKRVSLKCNISKRKLVKSLLIALVCLFTVNSYGQTWQIGYPNAAEVTATFNNGTLTISGTGDMQDWENSSDRPWDNIKDEIITIIINSGVKTIGNNAFFDFYNVTSVEIPDGITKIGNSSFNSCCNMPSINIPSSVTYIGDGVFAWPWCGGGLTDVTVNWETPLSIDESVFAGTNLSNVNLHVPSGSENLYARAPVWESFNIPGFIFIPTPFVQESKYIRFEMDDDRLLSITTDQLAIWLSDLDRMYEQYVDLMSGLSPSHDGAKLSIRCLPYDDVQAWARGGGNSIIWTNDYVSGTLTAFATDGDWSFGILHEMGHNFSGSLSGFGNGYNLYNWNEELFANFRMYLALTKLPDAMVEMGRYAGWKYNDEGEKEELPSVETKHYGAEIANYYQEDYDLKINGDNGYYRPMDEGIAMWGLIRLGNYYQQNNDHGFWLYKCAFAKINALPYESDFKITEWQKFNIFLDILSDCVGRDVRETFPTGELDLIESLMDGNVSSSPWQIGNPNTADVIASLDNETLTINGAGAMIDWGWGGNGQLPPWYYSENITNIIVNDGITTIGFYAFIDCTNAVSLYIGKDVKDIKIDAFWNCPAMKEIHIKNPIPPSVGDDNFFLGLDKTTCKLYVPSGSENAYKSADGWKDFYILVDDKTGIINVETGKINIYPNPIQSELFIKSELPISKVEIYSLTGALLLSENNFAGKISVSSLLKGTYIVKIYTEKGLTVSKVLKE